MISRRNFLGAAGALLGGAALAPLIRTRRAWGGATDFATRHVVIVGIGGGLRASESLAMAEGATMPNLFGTTPLIGGGGPAGAPRIAPEYAAMAPALVLPTPRPTPLYTQGTLITNLRYAEGAPGHLQGQACLMSGYYNNLENRADARLPVPTIFELHRRQANTPATDAWYISVPGGFYRALQASGHPDFGARFGGSFLSPPSTMSALVPIIASGNRALDLDPSSFHLPAIRHDPDEDAAVGRLRGLLDGNSPAYEPDDTVFRATPGETAALRDHVAEIFADDTYGSLFPASFGIGTTDGDGVDGTPDAITTYHAEQILGRFRPSILGLTLLDVDTCHADFNGYLRAQQIADACVAHLWDFIQADDELRDSTTLLILPEHGRHLAGNGQNPDSYGRTGIDHGQGDDGDRNVWMLALGPDIGATGPIAPTGITQTGRTSGRYESIDVVRTALQLLGHADLYETTLLEADSRPGLLIEEVLA
jgi:hypothetical protein